MKLHYMGTFDLNEESLPHRDPEPGAVAFREAKDSKQLMIISSVISIVILVVLIVVLVLRCRGHFLENEWAPFIGILLSLACMFPHELLHAICFKDDVYLYTNLKQGMLFVFLSLLPALVLGALPYLACMINPTLVTLGVFGAFSLSMAAGDFYNVFNALTQMPKGALTYLSGFHSYWFMPTGRSA